MGVAPTPAETATDVEMSEAAPQEQSGPLPTDVDAEIAKTQQAYAFHEYLIIV